MTFLKDLVGQLSTNLSSTEWWAGELPSWLVFSLIAGFLVSYVVGHLQAARDRREREPFEGWTLKVVGYNEEAQNLFHEDVSRFLTSDFELWKFVKSVVSGTCTVKLRSVEKAKGKWLWIDAANRHIIVDLEKIPDNHVSGWSEKPANRPVTVP
jgi:hypothetical protein